MSEKKLLATRAGYGQGLLDMGALHDDLIVLEGDLGAATGTTAFGKAYPDRYIEAGIAEQNEVGMASGLAAAGWKPFVTSFAIFTAGRACEIVRNAIAYNNISFLAKPHKPTASNNTSCGEYLTETSPDDIFDQVIHGLYIYSGFLIVEFGIDLMSSPSFFQYTTSNKQPYHFL